MRDHTCISVRNRLSIFLWTLTRKCLQETSSGSSLTIPPHFQGQFASSHSAAFAALTDADAVRRWHQRWQRIAGAGARHAAARRGRHQDTAAAAQAGLTGGQSCYVLHGFRLEQNYGSTRRLIWHIEFRNKI